jgi:hypothetical protein
VAKTNNQRFAEYYERKKTGAEIPRCKCDRALKGEKSQKRRLCNYCYKSSPDGKHQSYVAKNILRQRIVLSEMLESWGDWNKGDRAIAPDGSAGIVQAIACYINGNIAANVQFDDGTQDNFLLNQINCLISH